jgi:hypothetical protein
LGSIEFRADKKYFQYGKEKAVIRGLFMNECREALAAWGKKTTTGVTYD